MNQRLDADLARWEAGGLSLDELRRLHPGQDLDTVIAVHAQLTGIVDSPTPDAAAAWVVLASQLPTRATGARRPPRLRSRRAIIAAVLASVLTVPTVAYAAAPQTVRSVVRQVQDLLPGTNNDGEHGDTNDSDPASTTVPSTPPAPTIEADHEVPGKPDQVHGDIGTTSDPDQDVDGDGDGTSEVTDGETTDNGTSDNDADDGQEPTDPGSEGDDTEDSGDGTGGDSGGANQGG